MRGHLILNSRPHLIGVHERQRRFVAAWPRTEQQPGFVSHRISRTLRVGMLAQISLEIVFEDRLQRASHFLLRKWSPHSIHSSHPNADYPVRQAAGPILI